MIDYDDPRDPPLEVELAAWARERLAARTR